MSDGVELAVGNLAPEASGENCEQKLRVVYAPTFWWPLSVMVALLLVGFNALPLDAVPMVPVVLLVIGASALIGSAHGGFAVPLPQIAARRSFVASMILIACMCVAMALFELRMAQHLLAGEDGAMLMLLLAVGPALGIAGLLPLLLAADMSGHPPPSAESSNQRVSKWLEFQW